MFVCVYTRPNPSAHSRTCNKTDTNVLACVASARHACAILRKTSTHACEFACVHVNCVGHSIECVRMFGHTSHRYYGRAA